VHGPTAGPLNNREGQGERKEGCVDQTQVPTEREGGRGRARTKRRSTEREGGRRREGCTDQTWVHWTRGRVREGEGGVHGPNVGPLDDGPVHVQLVVVEQRPVPARQHKHTTAAVHMRCQSECKHKPAPAPPQHPVPTCGGQPRAHRPRPRPSERDDTHTSAGEEELRPALKETSPVAASTSAAAFDGVNFASTASPWPSKTVARGDATGRSRMDRKWEPHTL